MLERVLREIGRSLEQVRVPGIISYDPERDAYDITPLNHRRPRVYATPQQLQRLLEAMPREEGPMILLDLW